MPRKKWTTEEFIEKAKAVHGDRYDYSQVEYVNNSTKCDIVCKTHGVFSQSPNAHLKEHGCPKCGVNSRAEKRTYTPLDFVIKAEAVHGDKYDYSQVVYVNNKTKCDIVCKTHGIFEQAPSGHLQGAGCPQCGVDVRTRNLTGTLLDFVIKAEASHGDKYDYSRVKYVNARTKCDIVCETHGVFSQTPHKHLCGRGCPRCGIDSVTSKLSHTLLGFVVKAESVHGDKYDYSQVKYERAHKKCDFLCKTHGVFSQTPNSHLQGNGCPRCNESKGEKEVAALLTKYNLTFDPQKTFKGLRYKQPLECDFYVPEINTVIEYQGQHHYGLGINAERDTEGLYQIRDQIKRDFCKAKGIHLIEIPYWEDTETYLLGALLPILPLYPLKDLAS